MFKRIVLLSFAIVALSGSAHAQRIKVSVTFQGPWPKLVQTFTVAPNPASPLIQGTAGMPEFDNCGWNSNAPFEFNGSGAVYIAAGSHGVNISSDCNGPTPYPINRFVPAPSTPGTYTFFANDGDGGKATITIEVEPTFDSAMISIGNQPWVGNASLLKVSIYGAGHTSSGPVFQNLEMANLSKQLHAKPIKLRHHKVTVKSPYTLGRRKVMNKLSPSKTK